jgi:cobalt/nickel transport system permease protein
VAVFLSPWASELPDGLEFVGAKTGILNGTSESSLISAPLADYQIPLPGLRDLKVATAIVGVVGTLAVFGLSWGLARMLSSGAGERLERVPADAA